MLNIGTDKWSALWLVTGTLNTIGRPLDGKVKFRFLLIFTLHVVICTCIIIGQLTPWQTNNAKFLALEDLNVVYFTVLTQFQYMSAQKNLQRLMGMHTEKFPFPYKESNNQIKVNIESMHQETTMIKRISVVSTLYLVMGGLLPGLVGLYKINFVPVENVIEKEIPMPFNCWVPFSIKNNFNYLIVLFSQLVCLGFLAFIYNGWFIMILSSLLIIGTELKKLTSLVYELDTRTMEPNSLHSTQLNTYISWMAKYHNAIIRSVGTFNSNTTVMMLLFNQLCIIEQCITLYCILEVNDNSMKLQFFGLWVINMIVMTYFSSFGEFIIQGSDTFCRALENVAWIDKPTSFKKSLLLMITNAQRPLQIKPAGLYILNLHNIMLIVNAGYSYLNLMRSFKST